MSTPNVLSACASALGRSAARGDLDRLLGELEGLRPGARQHQHRRERREHVRPLRGGRLGRHRPPPPARTPRPTRRGGRSSTDSGRAAPARSRPRPDPSRRSAPARGPPAPRRAHTRRRCSCAPRRGAADPPAWCRSRARARRRGPEVHGVLEMPGRVGGRVHPVRLLARLDRRPQWRAAARAPGNQCQASSAAGPALSADSAGSLEASASRDVQAAALTRQQLLGRPPRASARDGRRSRRRERDDHVVVMASRSALFELAVGSVVAAEQRGAGTAPRGGDRLAAAAASGGSASTRTIRTSRRVRGARGRRPLGGGEQLLGEERVAVGAREQRLGHLGVGRRAEDAGELRDQLVAGERRELDALDAPRRSSSARNGRSGWRR